MYIPIIHNLSNKHCSEIIWILRLRCNHASFKVVLCYHKTNIIATGNIDKKAHMDQ